MTNVSDKVITCSECKNSDPSMIEIVFTGKNIIIYFCHVCSKEFGVDK